MSFSEFNVRNLFPTPLIQASFAPDTVADLKRKLVPMLMKKTEEMPSAYITNVGGWQSDIHIMEWGGEPVKTITGALTDLIRQVTMDIYNPNFDAPTDWKIYGWANVNRKGNYNVMHTHPGAYWSAIYYVQTDDKKSAGELELLDPRGTLPIMYNPRLRMRMEDYLSCGGHVLHTPKEGQCLLFPSWLPHAVNPYTGDGVRISLAFNFGV